MSRFAFGGQKISSPVWGRVFKILGWGGVGGDPGKGGQKVEKGSKMSLFGHFRTPPENPICRSLFWVGEGVKKHHFFDFLVKMVKKCQKLVPGTVF